MPKKTQRRRKPKRNCCGVNNLKHVKEKMGKYLNYQGILIKRDV